MRAVLHLAGAVALVAAVSTGDLHANQSDTALVHLDRTISVATTRIDRHEMVFPIEKDRFNNVLQANGFALIRKGVFFAQDIYADGFKRSDINVIVDGERYHSACPNRMDSPLTRANPLEMQTLELQKGCTTPRCGLGGEVSFHRSPAAEPALIRAGVSGSSGASEAGDLAFSAERRQWRLTGRYATGSSYEDGSGLSFRDLYNYREVRDYALAETSLSGRIGPVTSRLAFTYTDDVMFPYLHMDERLNRVYSGHLSWQGHKLYANYTDHLMDNGLRTGSGAMISDARNLTVGLSSDWYDFYWRRWDVDNHITTPMVTITNHMIPEVSETGGSIFYRFDSERWQLNLKVGAVTYRVGDEDRLGFYHDLYGRIDQRQSFLSFGLGLTRETMLGHQVRLGLMGEIASEPPSADNLFIAVRKPANKPSWSGNPELAAALRATLRTRAEYRWLQADLFATQVWDQVYLVRRSAGGTAYTTYNNLDVVMAGGSVGVRSRFANLSASYTWADKRFGDDPVAEIPPFAATLTLKTPEFKRLSARTRVNYNDSQTRVDPSLAETETSSWLRADLIVHYHLKTMLFTLTVENITDETYAQHLAYLRNPYSTGMKVSEPGRTIRLSVALDRLL